MVDVAHPLSLGGEQPAQRVLEGGAVAGRARRLLLARVERRQGGADVAVEGGVVARHLLHLGHQLAAEARQRRLLVVQAEVAADLVLRARQESRQPAHHRVRLVERELAHHRLDLALQIARQVALVGAQLAHQARQGRVAVVERELAQHLVRLLAQRRGQRLLDARAQPVCLGRRQHLEQRALLAQVDRQRARQHRLVAHVRAHHPLEIAAVADQAVDALRHQPALRIEVLGEGARHLAGQLGGALGQRLAHVGEQLVAGLAHRVGVEVSRRAAQRDHADPQRRGGVPVALGASTAAKLGQHIRIGESEGQDAARLPARGRCAPRPRHRSPGDRRARHRRASPRSRPTRGRAGRTRAPPRSLAHAAPG